MKNQKVFTRSLLQWNRRHNKRKMPWKGEKDPYRVWLSEVILQQTRVEQGWSYYEKFVNTYPNIRLLAAASDEAVFKLWEGLGYYTRCKNLLHTARLVAEKYDGNFPSDYDSIRSLKGVGSYTASAIASFCFDLPHAVVDGNVLRVLARFFGIHQPVDTIEGKKFFTRLAEACLDKKNAGEYNQAIMDFGATICKPAALCDICPLQRNCAAFKMAEVSSLPVKASRLQKTERWLSYFVFTVDDKKFVQQRIKKDIWQNLHEFFLAETASDPQWKSKKIRSWLKRQLNIESVKCIRIMRAQSQALTHRIINGYFIDVELFSVPASLGEKTNWLAKKALNEKAFPRFIRQYLSVKKPVC